MLIREQRVEAKTFNIVLCKVTQCIDEKFTGSLFFTRPNTLNYSWFAFEKLQLVIWLVGVLKNSICILNSCQSLTKHLSDYICAI